MESGLSFRLRRIYAALDASKESDLEKLTGVKIKTKKVFGLFNDFSNGDSPEELHNQLGCVLACIMTLRDILKSKQNELRITSRQIDEAFNENSDSLRIVRDLRVANEHGWPPKTSWTGLKPQVRYLRRVMQLRPKPNSAFVMTIDPRTGRPKTSGDGTAEAVKDLETFLHSIGVLQDPES